MTAMRTADTGGEGIACGQAAHGPLTDEGAQKILTKEGRLCAYPTCHCLARPKGRGHRKLYCEKHGNPYARLRLKKRTNAKDRRARLPNTICGNCGKIEKCHRHRLDRSAGYALKNVTILCLECHVAVHDLGIKGAFL
jgi:5-methylcytosine-specific restriction endonuclease McrA